MSHVLRLIGELHAAASLKPLLLRDAIRVGVVAMPDTSSRHAA